MTHESTDRPMDRTLLFRVVVLLGLWALAACTAGEAVVDLETEAPTWTGVIESGPFSDVPSPPGSLFWITVNPPGSGQRVGAIVRSDTHIVFRDEGGFRPGGASALRAGQAVRVWSSGSEYLSTSPMVDVTRVEVW